ncbi:uncharacterized protein SCHCODRAFT_02536981 [Schizophyllum commune H4-8]|nr:uncharacterized protein SCHCODRAFT_02536981 [Schizophyllum commune H4-8]KAI5895643.1 hypothetical protein SCHCODRAFT_02536981 [Schizophyllum commune H4-8]
MESCSRVSDCSKPPRINIQLREDDVHDEEVGVGEPIVLDSVSPQGLRAVSAHVLRAAAASNWRVVALRLPSRPVVGRFRRRLQTPRARSPTPENVAPSILPTSRRRCTRARGVLGLRGRNLFKTASPPSSTSFPLPRVVFHHPAWSVLAQVGLGDEYTEIRLPSGLIRPSLLSTRHVRFEDPRRAQSAEAMDFVRRASKYDSLAARQVLSLHLAPHRRIPRHQDAWNAV